MKAFKEFSIPLKGLADGYHRFEFSIDNAFFKSFENSLIKDGKFTISMDLDKRPSLIVLDFEINGIYSANCDRCLSSIQMPMDTSYQLLVKRSLEVDNDPDVMYIDPDAHEFNVASEIYEIIHLAIPLMKVVDCGPGEEAFCNQKVLDKFEIQNEQEEKNPLWDSLKDIKFNKK